MSRRGHETAEGDILKWVVYIALGVLWFFWPLSDRTQDQP
jgi:hypothetical protein